MWRQRPNALIMLALLATLTPASFVAAATRIVDISFIAINPGPVNPLRGSFRFETSTATGGCCTDSAAGGVGFPPSFVRVNYGSFTKANVLGAFEIFDGRGGVGKYRVEGKVSSLGVFLDGCCDGGDNLPAGDNFQLLTNFFRPFKPGQVIYKTSSSSRLWQNNEGGLIVRAETRISGS